MGNTVTSMVSSKADLDLKTQKSAVYLYISWVVSEDMPVNI